jgi:hypothetical protein
MVCSIAFRSGNVDSDDHSPCPVSQAYLRAMVSDTRYDDAVPVPLGQVRALIAEYDAQLTQWQVRGFGWAVRSIGVAWWLMPAAVS